MATDGDAGAEEQAGPKLSWIERERMQALQRLASARARLAELEEQTAPASRLSGVDPADLAEIDEIFGEIERLRPKATGRFGGAAAREQIEKLELRGRLVLERIGYGSYDALQADRSDAQAPTSEVDPVVLEFARREYADAEKAFFEVAGIDMPAAEAAEDDGEGAEVVDLRRPRPAAS